MILRIVSFFLFSLIYLQTNGQLLLSTAVMMPVTSDSTNLSTSYKSAAQVPLVKNQIVDKYFEQYASSDYQLFRHVIEVGKPYNKMIEDIFVEEGIPSELKYLAYIESNFQPYRTSPSGAKGLWQFVESTARLNGLKVNAHVDERLDPYKSTKAAAKLLKDMYSRYQDWLLVIAAYNCGEGALANGLMRTGNYDIWKMYGYLPRETREYVPNFCALVKVASEYNLFYPDDSFEPNQSPEILDVPSILATEKNTSTSDRQWTYHRVKNGDTLDRISRLYPGNTVESIKKNNKLGSSLLRPGKTLLIEVH